jgi:hypothetical protein
MLNLLIPSPSLVVDRRKRFFFQWNASTITIQVHADLAPELLVRFGASWGSGSG